MINLEYVEEKFNIGNEDAQKIYDTWGGNNQDERDMTFKEYVDGWVRSLTFDGFIHEDFEAFKEMVEDGFDNYVEYISEMTNAHIFKDENDNWIICPIW